VSFDCRDLEGSSVLVPEIRVRVRVRVPEISKDPPSLCLSRFKDSRIQRFKDSRIQGFKDSRIQEFKNSRCECACPSELSSELQPAVSSETVMSIQDSRFKISRFKISRPVACIIRDCHELPETAAPNKT